MSLDIIIPVHNEGANIIPVLDALEKSVKTHFRVFICYDNEDDDTLKAIEKYSNHCFNVINVKNSGKGAHGAVTTGFSASNADAVIVMPADDTFNASIIDNMYEKFRDGYEIVAPSRFIPGGCMEGAPLIKDLLVRVSSFTLYHFAGLPVHDASNGFRLFSRKVLREINIESNQGFVYSIELLVKCHRKGWKICEVPSQWFERTKGKSRFRVTKWVPQYLSWYFYGLGTTWLRLK